MGCDGCGQRTNQRKIMQMARPTNMLLAPTDGGSNCLKHGTAEEERLCNTQKCPDAPTGMSGWTGFSGNETVSTMVMRDDGCAPFACPPQSLIVTDVTSTSATVQWAPLASASSGYVIGLLPRDDGLTGELGKEVITKVVRRCKDLPSNMRSFGLTAPHSYLL